MKQKLFKKILLFASSFMLLVSCGGTPARELVSIAIHDEKQIYEYKEEFVRPGVTATYKDETTAEVSENSIFTGFNSSIPGDQTVTVSYSESNITKTISYLVTIKEEGLIFSKLEIDETTLVKEYDYGDDFVKPTVYAKYTNGSKKNVTSESTFTGFDSHSPGDQTITVSYNHDDITSTLTYAVKIKDPVKVAVSLTVSPDYKKVYFIKDEFVKPEVIVTFDDTSTKDVTYECNFTGFDSITAGTKTISVTYQYSIDNIVRTTFDVEVKVAESKMKFAIFADVQLCNDSAIPGEAVINAGNTTNAPLALKSHLEFCKKQGIKTILMNGDVTNQANEHYYDFFERIFKEVYGEDESTYPEFVWNMGNHEWWGGVTETESADAVSMFKEYARIESENLVKESEVPYYLDIEETLPSYYKVINGVPFIVVSAENSAGEIKEQLRGEIESWLADAKTLSSVKDGGPIFVEYHYPLSTSMTHGEGSSRFCSTIEDIFKDTPNAVIFTGDTHYSGINERAINQVDFTTINLGSSSYSRNVNKSAVISDDYENVISTGGKSRIEDALTGCSAYMQNYTSTIQIVDVFEDNTFTIDRYFTEDGGEATHVGQQWKFDRILSKDDFKYTNDRFLDTNSARELYGAEGLSWPNEEVVKFGVDTKTHQATVIFKDVNEFKCVEHYVVDINGVEHDFASSSYSNPKEKVDNYFIIEDVPEADNYEVTVTAYDFFDNPSLNTLSTTVNDTSICVDPIDNNLLKFQYADTSKKLNFEDVGSASSHSSGEFYYKGIYTYPAGATVERLINGTDTDVTALDYISFDDSVDDEPVLIFKAKSLSDDDMIVGFSYVYNDGSEGGVWKTDFGTEIQKTIKGDGQWHEVAWDLKNLYGVTKISEIKMLQIKVKSTNVSSAGYEMGILIDDVDICQYSGKEPIGDRGFPFAAGKEYTKVLSTAARKNYDTINVDIKYDNPDSQIDMIFTRKADWDKYLGYFNITPTTKTGDYDGLTVSTMKDGYIRYEFYLPEVSKNVGGYHDDYDLVWFNPSTTASGYVDISVKEGPYVPPARGVKYNAGEDLTIALEDKYYDEIEFDVKFLSEDDKILHVCLLEEWGDYFGYFDLKPTSKTGDYNGLTVTILDDGYMKFNFDLTKITKKEGTPEYSNRIYSKVGTSSATYYIDVITQ